MGEICVYYGGLSRIDPRIHDVIKPRHRVLRYGFRAEIVDYQKIGIVESALGAVSLRSAAEKLLFKYGHDLLRGSVENVKAPLDHNDCDRSRKVGFSEARGTDQKKIVGRIL